MNFNLPRGTCMFLSHAETLGWVQGEASGLQNQNGCSFGRRGCIVKLPTCAGLGNLTGSLTGTVSARSADRSWSVNEPIVGNACWLDLCYGCWKPKYTFSLLCSCISL